MITYAHVKQTPTPAETQWSAVPNYELRSWWGYLHSNGSLQVKPWFGDVKDYTDDCENNEFTPIVVPPFRAATYEDAARLMRKAIEDLRAGVV